jgi:hypothetical protein
MGYREDIDTLKQKAMKENTNKQRNKNKMV